MDTTTKASLEWDLADRMRKAREVAGLNQTQMAERLSVARSSVVNYEKRHTTPIPSIRKEWARVCGVTDEWLRDGNVTGEERRLFALAA